MKQIAIFASGGGSNALKIIAYFKQKPKISVKLIVCNRQNAGVLDKADDQGIETLLINRSYFYESEKVVEVLKQKKIDLIVLAGFLWLIPSYLVEHFEQKIINIHPALLPKFGGKGMYGQHVHKAVKAAGETQSGLTIHYVNSKYDGGNIILQRRCELNETDSATDIAKKVLKLEHRYYPIVIEDLLMDT